MNIKPVLQSNKWLWLSILLILLLYGFSFYNRLPNDDEGMIAEWGYWILAKGHACSSLMEPFGAGFEHRITVYHKLTAWLTLPIISLFSMNLYLLKSLVFLFFIGLCFIGYKYTQKEPNKKGNFFFWFLLIYSLNARVFEYAFTFRPEIIMSAFGFGSFYFLKQALDAHRIKNLVWGSIFAGLAFLSHLNGISYLIAGFILLLIYKQFKFAFWYGVIAGSVALLYFIDMLDTNIYQAIVHDLTNSPDVKDEPFSIFLPFIKLLNEQQRFFQSPIEISLSLLFIATLVFSKRELFKTQKPVLIYILLLFVVLGSLTSGKTPKYFLVYVPFITLVIAFFIDHLSVIKNWKRYVLIGLLAIYFGVQGFYVTRVYSRHYNLSRTNTIVLNQIPKGSRVLSHSNLVFGGIGDYQIHSFLTFYWCLYHERGDTFHHFLNFAHDYNEDYVVVTKYYFKKPWIDEMNFDHLMVGDSINGYEVGYKDQEIAVFKQID